MVAGHGGASILPSGHLPFYNPSYFAPCYPPQPPLLLAPRNRANFSVLAVLPSCAAVELAVGGHFVASAYIRSAPGLREPLLVLLRVVVVRMAARTAFAVGLRRTSTRSAAISPPRPSPG